MPPITNGQTFPTLLDFKAALRQWAIEGNWTPHILDSDSHRVRAGCRSTPNCPFRIRANFSAKRGDAKVTTVEDLHTCDPLNGVGPSQRAHQDIKRAETGKLKFLLEVVPTLMTVTVDTSIHDIIATVEQHFGQKIPTRQAQKVKGGLVTRVKGPCRHCHRMGHTRRHCPQLKNSTGGPLDFSHNDSTMDISRDGDGAEHDFRAGMNDTTFGDESMTYHDESTTYNPTHDASNSNVDPGLEQAVGEPDFAASPIAPRSQMALSLPSSTTLSLQNSRAPFPPQPGIPPNGLDQDGNPAHLPSIPVSTARTNAEKRAEAARLTQQATALMQQAMRMQTEASRLLESIGEGT